MGQNLVFDLAMKRDARAGGSLGEWPLMSSKEFDRYLDDSVAM